MILIRERKINNIKVISKSIMAAEKQQQQQKQNNNNKTTTTKMLAEIFCIFQCLLTQNPTNQGSQLF